MVAGGRRGSIINVATRASSPVKTVHVNGGSYMP